MTNEERADGFGMLADAVALMRDGIVRRHGPFCPIRT